MPSRKRTFFCAFWLLIAGSDLAGQSDTISGRVVDSESGKAIHGAIIQITAEENSDGVRMQGQTVTDMNGYFTLPVPGDHHQKITVRHLAYYTLTQEVGKEEQTVHVRLTEAIQPLEEIIIYSLRAPATALETSLPLEVRTRKQWQMHQPTDLSEVLGAMPGITLSGDGMWARSAQLRGLGEDRYVSMVNGSRIETAHDLAGALATIDMNDVERIEVIKGALSSVYGSGAMGGVVNIITRKGAYSADPYVHGQTVAGYHSVNHLLAPALSLTAGHRVWNARLHLGYRQSTDARSPEGPIANSQFSDWNISGNISVRPFADHEFSAEYQQFRATAGIPGGSPFPPSAEATYRDADRTLLSVEYSLKGLLPKLQVLKVKYYRQSIFRNVEIRPNVPPRGNAFTQVTPVLLNPSARHTTQGIILESRWQPGNGHTLVTGLDAWQRSLNSRRKRYLMREQLDETGNVLSSTEIIRGEVPIPVSRSQNMGWFLQHDFHIHPKWKLGTGGRIDWIRLTNMETRDPDFIMQGGERMDHPPGQIIVYPSESSSDYSWAIHGSTLFQPSEVLQLTGSAGRSYRAPSLEERYKHIDLGYAVELGNPDLIPEKGYFFDAGLKIHTAAVQLTANVFLNLLDDMITMAPADSVAFMLSDESGYSDNIFARRYQNISRATLTGFDAQASWLLYPGGMLYGNIGYVHGKDRLSGDPLPGIAPLNGALGIRQKVGTIGKVELRSRFFNSQNRVAEDEKTTAGYTLIDAYVRPEPIKTGKIQMQITAGVENMLNTRYRNHLATNRGSWVVEPGRNIKLQIGIIW